MHFAIAFSKSLKNTLYRNFFASLLGASPLATFACAHSQASLDEASVPRATVEQLDEAAPDQDTLHNLLMAAPAKDADELADARATRESRSVELMQIYTSEKSELSRANALFELLALQRERAADLRDQATANFQIAYDHWWIGEPTQAPSPDLAAYKEAMQAYVNSLREMVANFPLDPRLDDVEWQLGSAMARLGNDHCEHYFAEVVARTKNTELLIKTKLSRADLAAAQNHWDIAIKAYEALRVEIKTPNDPLRAYATYRLGWAFINSSEHATTAARPELLNKAAAALKLAFLSLEEDQQTRFQLKAAAAGDLAWIWAVQDKEKEAVEFAEKQNLGSLVALFHERQAREWLRQGKIAQASSYYTALIAKDPENAQVPDYHWRLARAYVMAGNFTAMHTELATLAKLSSDGQDPWWDKHKDEPELIARAKTMVTQLPLAAGFTIFTAAMAEKNPSKKRSMLTVSTTELQNQAKTTANPARLGKIRLALLQAFRELARPLDELDQIDAIIKASPPSESFLPELAFERLKILVALDSATNYPATPAPGEAKSPLPLPPLKQRFAAAATDYLKFVPQAENTPNLRYQIAQDLFTYGHYAEALPLFEALVSDFPGTEQAKVGIETSLSMNLKFKNYPELIRLATTYLNNRSVKGKVLREYIKQNLDWAKDQTATAH